MKKKRAANFTSEEKDQLLTTVLKYRDVLFERVTIGNDTPQKSIAWSKIIMAVNSVSYVHRSLQDIRRKLKDLKAATRKKYMTTEGNWRDSLKVKEVALEEQKILALLGNEEAIDCVDIQQEVPVIKEDPIDPVPIPCILKYDELTIATIKSEEPEMSGMKSKESFKRPAHAMLFCTSSAPNRTPSTSPHLANNSSHLTPLKSKHPVKKIKLYMHHVKTSTEEFRGILDTSAMVGMLKAEGPMPPPALALSVSVGVQTDEPTAIIEALRAIANSLKTAAVGLEHLLANMKSDISFN